MIIHLISGPRNVSTALMYSFAQRPDTKVVDEPFYAYYLKRTGVNHPGRAEILQAMETEPDRIYKQIEQLEEKYGMVFLKNMGHHLPGQNLERMKQYANVFLIRDPGQMLLSYHKVRECPTLNDIGLQQQAEFFSWLQDAGKQPLVIDGNELRKNPASVLQQLCQKLSIPFVEGMLEWPAGARAEDGIWAPYWYAQVHQSTKFLPPEIDSSPLPAALQETYHAALPYYNTLKNNALIA